MNASVRNRRGSAGFSLIELMISLVIGLIVIGGAVSLFAANRQTYRATEGISRLQENARIAFELMARDVREAAGNPCGKNLPIANVLNTTAGAWWTGWGDGIRGYAGNAAFGGAAFGTAAGERVAGTEALELRSGQTIPGVTIVQHVVTSARFDFNVNNHSLEDGDIVMVCDYRQASIFQVTNSQTGTNSNVVHNTGGSTVPGNCSKGLGFPPICTSNGNGYQYSTNSILTRLNASGWYIGNNGRGGNSLYRVFLVNTSGTPGAQRQEVAENITGMTLGYLLPGNSNYVDAGSVGTRWGDVIAVRITLTVVSPEGVGTTNNQRMSRTLQHVVTLRNRNA